MNTEKWLLVWVVFALFGAVFARYEFNQARDEAKATMYYFHLSQCLGTEYEHACVRSNINNPQLQ